MIRNFAIVFAAALAVLAAQAPPGGANSPSPAPPVQAPPGANGEKAPVLAELDRLRIVNALQAVELWTLKVQAAAAELQKARSEAEKVIAGLQVPGWQLNERLEYVKAPPGKDGK